MSEAIEREVVVLVDAEGNSLGTEDKRDVHGANTPLHLAFSCYVFDAQERLLVSRRALGKRVFPGVWTNSVCGHPAPNEGLEAAVARRARLELGIALDDVRIVLPGFAYRAEMDGIVEYELCPVVTAHLHDHEFTVNPDEVAAVDWIPWKRFADEVLDGKRTVSPWCALQVEALSLLGDSPSEWPEGDHSHLPKVLRDL